MNTFVYYLPLGIRPQVVLSTEQRRALCMLENYDLSAVRRRLLAEGLLPHALVDEAILEFRRFLALHVVLGRPVGMISAQVDHVWHTCLLFSRLYADLCERVFGRFVHHEPEGDPVAESASALGLGTVSAVEDFEAAYRRVFGPLGRLWQWQDGDTPERAAAALSAKLTALARTLPPGELNALEQVLVLAAVGFEVREAAARPPAA
ncbi:MAG TPA: hypothetical protein VFE37_12415 [Chloroflexota bacterium]|nr:hypothetical protein [Chloroflexota bacterium]